jgi:hypothetical protein
MIFTIRYVKLTFAVNSKQTIKTGAIEKIVCVARARRYLVDNAIINHQAQPIGLFSCLKSRPCRELTNGHASFAPIDGIIQDKATFS